MTAPKPVSNIFDVLDATISAIGSVGEGRFGHRLGIESGPLHNANPLTGNGFRHFGQFEHLKQETLGSEPPDVDRKTDHEATSRGSRVRAYPSQMPKVPKLPNFYIDQGFEVEHQTPSSAQSVLKTAGNAGGTVNDISPDALKALREAFRQPKNPAPASDAPDDWRQWLQDRTDYWLGLGYLPIEAGRIAWGEAENVWHWRHGAEPSLDRCAGCDALMLDDPGMSLPDGAAVHVGQDQGLECLIAYGQKWRGAAYVGLGAMGLEPLGRRS
jgi:hypothetical protein